MVFAGTPEGRELCEKYENQNIKIDAYTATEFGGELLPECDNIVIHSGRLDSSAMAGEIKRLRPFLVIDATQPYATEASANIKKAAGKKYIRLLRSDSEKVKALYADNIDKAIALVNRSKGNILITTGLDDIEKYTAIKDYSQRCVIRVSPNENVARALDLGFRSENIIIEEGPFTTKINIEHIKRYKIKYLISKDTGKTDGFIEKYYACQNQNAVMVVIKRPVEDGYRASELYSIIEKTMYKKQISVIGIGPGNPDNMTIEAYRHIKEAELIIGAKRMVDSVDNRGSDLCYEYRADKIKEVIDTTNYNKIAVLFSGDVCVHSGAANLLKLLEDYDTYTIQGISSITYLASKLGISWTGSKTISCHVSDEGVAKAVAENKSVFVLTSGNVSEISQVLINEGLNDVHICVGERLSYDDEKISVGYPEDFINKEFDSVTLMYVENLNYGRKFEIGIDDDEFIRGSVPMTKSEIRTLAITAMGISSSSVVYDIGAGTGSISIEASRLGAKVYAIECNENAVDIIQRNIDKFSAKNIVVVKGYAAEALKELPNGDIAFIGGSKGQLNEIVDILKEKGVRTIVMTAIAIESLYNMITLAKENKWDYDVKQVSVARGKRSGDITMMLSENPIYIVKITRKESKL